jgi:hypothetical protein
MKTLLSRPLLLKIGLLLLALGIVYFLLQKPKIESSLTSKTAVELQKNQENDSLETLKKTIPSSYSREYRDSVARHYIPINP